MMIYIIEFWNELVALTVEMAPYLLLGFLFAGILYAWFPEQKISRYLGQNNSASVFNASLLGVPLPLCSCGVIPTGISFYKNGASKGASLSFLISTPQTGVDSMLVTWSLLGLPMAIIRPIIAFFTGILGGLLTNASEKNRLKKTDPPPVKVKTFTKQKVGIMAMLKYAFVDFMEDIVKWLVIGLLIAALIAVILPADFFLTYLSNDYLSMIIILVASIPLYVCATGSVPIAAVLMLKGLSPGAAIVFLMAGPATNAATISVIGNSMGKKTLFLYLFSIISGALISGILVNELIPREFFTNSIAHIHGEHTHGILPHWLQNGSAVILSILIVYGLLRKFMPGIFKIQIKKTQIIKTQMMKTVNVEGMTCNHCKSTVEKNIGLLEGVEEVSADISNGNVIIQGEFDVEKVAETVTALGYNYKGIVV